MILVLGFSCTDLNIFYVTLLLSSSTIASVEGKGKNTEFPVADIKDLSQKLSPFRSKRNCAAAP